MGRIPSRMMDSRKWEKHSSKGRSTYNWRLSSQVTSQHVNLNLLWFTLLLCEDIWAMVFLAIQPNLANPDLLTLCSLVSLLQFKLFCSIFACCFLDLWTESPHRCLESKASSLECVESADVEAEHFLPSVVRCPIHRMIRMIHGKMFL